MESRSPRLSNNLNISIPMPQAELTAASDSACSSYESYLRLQELKKLWSSKEFPGWKDELILKPAFIGLEITFRFISTVLSDPRPYANMWEWKRRLQALTTSEIEIIALLCEDDVKTRAAIPIVDVTSSDGVLARETSSAEVRKMSDETTVVSRVSEASLLPRLATWHKSEELAKKILYSIEREMHGIPYTLGLGEPNLAGKPTFDYDAVCKPTELHAFKKCPSDNADLDIENQTLYATHQILESWICVSKFILERIRSRIDSRSFENASSDCWILEKVWKLLKEIEDLHLLMDPDDFLRLKNRLSIKATSESDSFCFRSRELVEITKLSKDLKHKVPTILDVEVDPKGGPRIQGAAMKLYRKKAEFEKIHLLQAMQAVEMAVKSFYFSYKQLVTIVMGSLEAMGNRTFVNVDSGDLLGQIYLEPTYFPSLDAAKTFLDSWGHERGR
ncbi:unnamed protein product [Fraxinus pennsylvanica]|uniref:Nematode resistance protein-like HSPRO2 n=1 Tax=Fraxinus pennsylvanica TaxID=56036 RepID=A0AAD2E1S3_9LAMI|nr:unnamed protein product [Fraxinus pennsylvanica]